MQNIYKLYKITVNLHESGHGFQIVFDGPGVHKAYPDPITDIKDAPECTLGMQEAFGEEIGIIIPERDVRVAQRAVEYNATATVSNLNAYRDVMSGKIKPQGER